MAVKPIISVIVPWDATSGTNIVFSYSGNLPVKARGIVRNASTLTIVWDQLKMVSANGSGKYLFPIEPYAFKANPADTDANGNKFCIQLIVYDNNDEASPTSDKAYFWCMKAPEFVYTSPKAESLIENTFIQLRLYYKQDNGEKLYHYRHYLYDNSKNIIARSEQFYDESGYDYAFKGLENKTSYYIRAEGLTKNNIPVDTGYIHVFINYEEVDDYSILSVESDSNATVTGTTNMICIDADEDSDEYIFINSLVQLIGKKVTYQTNYKIPRDFTLQIKITKALYNGTLLTMYNKEFPNYTVILESYLFDDGLIRYCLKAFNGLATYVLYSEGLDVDNEDYIVVTIRRVKNFFSLKAEEIIA